MSIEHINAALCCNRFTGNTRVLLFVLADAASNGKPRKDGGKNLPYGWTSRSRPQLMKACNMTRGDTLTNAINNLADAGAIRRKRRFGKSDMTFIDIEWLKANDTKSVSTDVSENATSVERSGKNTETVSTDTRKPCQSVDTKSGSSVDTKSGTLSCISPVFKNPQPSAVDPQALPENQIRVVAHALNPWGLRPQTPAEATPTPKAPPVTSGPWLPCDAPKLCCLRRHPKDQHWCEGCGMTPKWGGLRLCHACALAKMGTGGYYDVVLKHNPIPEDPWMTIGGVYGLSLAAGVS